MPAAPHIVDWVSQLASEPSLLAWGLREPDCAPTSYSNSPELSTTQLDEAWQRLADATAALAAQRLPAQRLCWTYEHAVLHFVVRPDGLSLGLVTLTGSDAPEPAMVDNVAAEFLGLP